MATVLDFDEIRKLARETYEKAENKPLEQRKKEVEDWFDELLIDAYIAGLTGTGLPIDPVMDSAHVKNDVLLKVIAGKTYRDRVREHVENGDVGRIENLAETESHRVYENGGYDTAEQMRDKLRREREDVSRKTGKQAGRIKRRSVVKTWITMRDERVRATHDYIDGMYVPFDSRFYTFDGDSARFPGDFSKPDNNCGCRCVLHYSIQ